MSFASIKNEGLAGLEQLVDIWKDDNMIDENYLAAVNGLQFVLRMSKTHSPYFMERYERDRESKIDNRMLW